MMSFETQIGAMGARLSVRRLLLLSASVAALSGSAYAQTPAPAEPAQTARITTSGGSGLEQVVVTARRRSERLQTVPVAITALSTKELERKGITSTNDLARAVPSLTVGGQTRNNSQFYLRGQTPGVINQGVHNPASVVAYYLEVPTLTSGPGVFFDMASVDILKGPQGTLFGRNTTGGAILFTPQKPKNDYSGYITGRVGNFAAKELEGAINLGLIPEKLTVRVSGATARRDGFTTNVTTGQKLDDRHYDSYRVSIDAHPTEEIDNLFVVDGRQINQQGTSSIPYEFNSNAALGTLPLPPPLNVPFTFGGTKPSIFCLQGGKAGYSFGSLCPAGGLGGALVAGIKAGGFSFYSDADLNKILANQRKLGPRQFASDGIFMDQERTTNVTNITTWNITPDILVKNIAGYRFNRVNQASDFAGTNIPIIRNINGAADYGEDALEQLSEEFQVQGTTLNSKLKYIVGAYYEHATPGGDTYSNAFQFGPPIEFKAANPAGYAYLLNANNSIQRHAFNDSSTSVFVHGEYDLASVLPGLKFAGGARYNWDSNYARVTKFLSDGVTCAPNPVTGVTAVPCSLHQAGSFEAPTWSAVLSDQINSNWLAYASASRGYKSGGNNLPSPQDAAGNYIYATFKPEYITAYEVGSKNDYHLWDTQARSNISLFYDNYRDIQVSYATIASGQLASIVRNAPTATIEGAELEQVLLPIHNLTIGGYVSWLHAVFGAGSVLDGISVKDRQLPYSPIFKYGATATYTIPLGENYGALALTANWARQNHYMTADPLDPVDFFKGYDVVNLRADWTNIYNKPLDFSLVVNNLMDKTYASGGYPIYGLAGFNSRIYGEPRMILGQLTFRWGPNAKW